MNNYTYIYIEKGEVAKISDKEPTEKQLELYEKNDLEICRVSKDSLVIEVPIFTDDTLSIIWKFAEPFQGQ